MTTTEAAELLTLLRASWPRLAQDEVADRLWLEDLMRLDHDDALKAFRLLRDTSETTPSWAHFLRAYERGRPNRWDRLAVTEGRRAVEG